MDLIKSIAIVLVALSSLGIVCIVLRKENSFYNVFEVIQYQHKLLEGSPIQKNGFYVLPLLLSAGLAVLFVPNDSFISSMITIVCMLLSILLAALAIIASSNTTNVVKEEQRKNVNSVTKETIFSISYAAYLSILLLFYLLVISAVQVNSLSFVLAVVLTGMGYYAFFLIILTLLIIIKRIWKLKELDVK